MPYYNVSVSAYCDVFVKARSAEAAMDRACDEISFGDFELDTGGPAQELKGKDEVDSYRRHAEVRLPDLAT